MFLIKTMHNKKRRRNFLTSPLVFIRFFALSRKSICHILFGLIISRVAVGQRISSCASAQHIELMVALVPASIYRKSAYADLYRVAKQHIEFERSENISPHFAFLCHPERSAFFGTRVAEVCEPCE